jgi:hypothetical protein
MCGGQRREEILGSFIPSLQIETQKRGQLIRYSQKSKSKNDCSSRRRRRHHIRLSGWSNFRNLG